MAFAVCGASHARYQGRREPTTPGSRMDYGGYDSHSSGGVEVGPKLYLNLVASLLVRFGFAERKLGHRKSSRIGVSIDDHQARIELERWRPGWGVSPHRCRWRRLEYTTLASTRLTLSTIPLPSFLAAESLRIRPGVEEFAFPSSSSAMSTVRCLSAKRAIADHPFAA